MEEELLLVGTGNGSAQGEEQEAMIRRLTLYVVPVAFAIILFIGLIGNTLVIFVVRSGAVNNGSLL
jgi:hypothetical protein